MQEQYEEESFRNKFRDSVLAEMSWSNKEKSTISPYMQVAMQPEPVWEALETVFAAADKFKLKNQKVPKEKKLHRNSIELASAPKISGSSYLAKDHLATLTAGNLSIEDKVVILKELAAGNKSLEECMDLANDTKMLNTVKQNFLAKAFPKFHNTTWDMAVEKFGTLISNDKLKAHMTKGKTKGSVKLSSTFDEWVEKVMAIEAASQEPMEVEDDVAVVVRQNLRFEFRTCNVLKFDNLNVTKRNYSLIVIDPPYGLGLAPWDVKV